ncbi:MAG: hypothetical protein K2Q23_09420 [Bryobacteraceae bacterium]|nr:hypothetical protein [Bryobacteraceae bacterium]
MSASDFRVGVSHDFYTDVKGKFETHLASKLSGFSIAPMPSSPRLDDYDAIFALNTRVTPDLLPRADRLTVIARWGVGYDLIDTDALTRADVALAITPNAVRRPVAEAIYSLIFALSTNLLTQDRLVRQGHWRAQLPRLGWNIKHRVLASLGFGNIAQEMFSMARSLGFRRLLACDPYARPDVAKFLGVELVDQHELFSQADYLTVNTPLLPSTRGLVNADLLRLMKPTAFLINTARGPIVNQADLTRALQENWIAGAGLDVFETEPLPPDDPLRQLDNVILAPHGLAWTEEIARDNTLEACDNILTIAAGSVPHAVVNKEVLERPGFVAKLERYRAAQRNSSA